MTWRCPECGSTDLCVEVHTMARLSQTEDNFETEIEGGHEWNKDSFMECSECRFNGNAYEFEEDDE